jgi:hypothetical protein
MRAGVLRPRHLAAEQCAGTALRSDLNDRLAHQEFAAHMTGALMHIIIDPIIAFAVGWGFVHCR